MPSFDIVSEADLNEVKNAIGNVMREIETRYDFKGSQSRVEEKDGVITIHADDDLKLRQVHEILQGTCRSAGSSRGCSTIRKWNLLPGSQCGKMFW